LNSTTLIPGVATATGAPPRVLGTWMCTALVVGNVIGIGIFVLPAALAPYGLNALTAWLITVVGCSFLAICFAALARSFPKDDGPYTYTTRAFGNGVAFTVMWCYWVSTFVTNATIAVGVVGYMTVFLPWMNYKPWLPPVVALSLIWFFVLLNMRGARAVGWTQIMTTALKLMPMIGVVCLGLWVLLTHPSAYTEHVPPNPVSFADLSGASTLALYAMLGIECATIPACRVADPERTIPRATVIGTIVTAAIYIGVSAVPMLLIPQKTLAASNAPFADLFGQVLGARSGEILALFIAVGGLGALNGWTMILGDVTQGIARHGHFPRWLSKENAHGAPTYSLIVSSVIASIMLISNYSQSVAGLYTFLSVVVTAANMPMYFMLPLAIVVLGRRGEMPSRKRPGWLYAAALSAVAYCAWTSVGIGLEPLLWSIGLCAVGIPTYWVSRYRLSGGGVRIPNSGD
jgi:basic amino acid/polyamine antiporter, APA family